MQATSNIRAQNEQDQRRRQSDKISTASATCIPMQLASMQAADPQLDSQGRPIQNPEGTSLSGLRSDCWNSPLCPRNIPSNSGMQGIFPSSCGSSGSTTQHHTGDRSSPTTEVCIQSPATTVASSSASVTAQSNQRPSTKRAKTHASIVTNIKADSPDSVSPLQNSFTTLNTPPMTTTPNAGSKEKRLPHHVIERRYRENLNSQIESLRAAVPTASACLTPDMEDIGGANSGSAIRPLSKAAVIAHAAEYMRQLSAQNQEVERMNRELRVTVEALRRLVNCEDCGMVQQIVDAGT